MKTLISIVCVVFLSACSTGGSGPAMVPVQSALFDGAGYASETQILTVQFNHGAVWDFQDVPAETWTDFQKAPDALTYYTKHIKGVFEGRRRLSRRTSR